LEYIVLLIGGFARRAPDEPVSEVMVPLSPELYARVSRRAEYDGIPVRKVMETALQQFVQHV
jgi:hypothetical protein